MKSFSPGRKLLHNRSLGWLCVLNLWGLSYLPSARITGIAIRSCFIFFHSFPFLRGGCLHIFVVILCVWMICLCIHVHVYVCISQACVPGALKVQKEALDYLVLELQLWAAIKITMWVLETETGSLTRAASTFNSWAISPVSLLFWEQVLIYLRLALMWPRKTLNFWSSCFHLLIADIVGLPYHAWFLWH